MRNPAQEQIDKIHALKPVCTARDGINVLNDAGSSTGFCDFLSARSFSKQKIKIPESLADYAEVSEEDFEEDVEPPITAEELASGYDYILDCLQNAHGLLKKAYQFSLIDTNRKKRAATVVKYACIADAQSYISAALDTWNLLDLPNQDKQPLRGIWPNISNSTMWQNYLFEGFFTNMLVKREIRKVMKNIEAAYNMIRKQRNNL